MVALPAFKMTATWALLCCCLPSMVAAQKISVHGASGAGPYSVAREWATAFKALYPEADLTLNRVNSGSTQKALWGDVDCEKHYIESICKGVGLEEGASTVWGISDAPFSRDVYREHPELDLKHLPAIGEAIVPIMSTPTDLNMTLQVLADIFSSKIVYWDDPALVALNPNADLPHLEISVIVRGDSSGQTYIFTDALDSLPDWPVEAVGTKPKWELNNLTEFSTEDALYVGNASVTRTHYESYSMDELVSAVLRTPWSIGYVAGEHYYAISDFLAQVNIGKAGSETFISASDESVLNGLASPTNTMDPLTQDVVFGDEMPPDAFPVVGYAYWYLKKSPTGYHDCYQAWLVAKFIEWTYTDPQASSIASKHGWVVPPPHVVEEAKSHLAEIKCFDLEGGNPETPIPVFDYTPPRFYHEENYIGDSLEAVGFTLMAIMTLMSLICALFLYLNRKEWHVKVGQPHLLGVVILGCFISSLSIAFMGSETGQHQDNIDFVDSSCMVVPWFYGIGFVLTFSMLFAKIMRVKLIFVAANDQAKTGKKKRIGFSSVIHIVAFMLLFELAILISWQFFSPLEWQREITAEENGLVVESYGECRSDHGFLFYAALVIFHILCLLYALVLCIQTSHIDSSFAESKYISLSVAFMFQVLLLAVPISALVRDNTEVFYLVRVLAIFLQNFTVLALLFIPKMMKVIHDGNAARLEKQHGAKSRKKSTIKLSALTNSKWDQAVDAVNELLTEDSPTYLAMTEDQIAELESVKVLLLERTDDKSDKMRHLPMQLLGAGLKKLGKTSSQEDVVDHETAAFIMREFGGVSVHPDSSSQRGTSTTSDVLDTEDGVECNTLRSEDASLFLLPEFKALSKESQRKVCKMLSWESVKTWGFNVFDLVDAVGEKPLLFMGWAVMGAPHAQQAMARACGLPEAPNDGYDFVDSELQIPLDVLCEYLRSIDNDYRAGNPYHNATHAADVLQSLHALIQMKPDLHCTKVELFSILLAAAVHDVDHPGQNNAFQVNCKSDLALIYNDKSVLENKHVSHAFMKMLGDDSNQLANRSRCTSHINHGNDSGLNVLCNASEKNTKLVRSKVIDAILNTDMTQHFVMVNTLKGFVMGMEDGAELNDESRWKVLVYMMHLADISGQAKPDPLFLIWTDRVMEEFFAQGDREAELGLPISQLCDRKTTNPHDSQIGFIDYVIQPAYEVLGELVPEVKRLVMPMIQSNHDYFVREKAAEKPQECAL